MAKVTVPAVLPELFKTCAGMLPVPLAVNPVIPAVPVAVQLNVVPVTFEFKAARTVEVPLQIVWKVGRITLGSGSTTIS